jgi:3-oxoacyl-[acyl-carrier-protein] synthase III
MSFRTRISGTGHYLPEAVLTNQDLEKMVDTNDQWIVERTGIRRRHMAKGEVTSDLAEKASRQALADAGLESKDIDCIIVATVGGDQTMPSTACVLQDKLKCRNIMAFDLSAACSGFVYGLSIADQFIRNGVYKHVLVVGAEVLHPYVDYSTRDTSILFGDGAGAWIVSQTDINDPAVIYSSHSHADGSLSDLLIIPTGGSKLTVTKEILDEKGQYIKMKGREIFKNAVRAMVQCCEEALAANSLTSDQIDWVIPHQANVRIIQSVAENFNIPMDKVIVSIEETGNTSAASIPIAFGIGKADGRIKRGQTILLTAFGAGLTSGSLVFKY